MPGLVVVIPVFRHGEALRATAPALAALGYPVIVVDDGNSERQGRLIRGACQSAGASLIVRKRNGGKGAAVIDGLREAARQGHSHAFQIDADGQHDFSRFTEFAETARRCPGAMILGYPRYSESAPLSRRLGRLLTRFFVCLNTMSLSIRDSMCGFRIMPIAPVLEIIDKADIGRHMDFDPELCVRARWEGLPIVNLPVGVEYPETGVSNFRLKQDNVLISLMHTRLFLGMLVRLPVWLLNWLRAITGRRQDPGAQTHWSGQKERAGYMGMRLLMGIMRLSGPWLVKQLVIPVALYYYLFASSARAASADYLSRLIRFAEARGSAAELDLPRVYSGWLSYRHILGFARALVDRVYIWSTQPDLSRFNIEGREYVEDVFNSAGRGAVVLVSHLGNFDLTMAICKHTPDKEFIIFHGRANAGNYAKLRDGIFRSGRMSFVDPGRISPPMVASLMHRVAAGAVVIIAADRTASANDSSAVEVDFLGAPALFPAGPYILASLLEAPVYSLSALTERGGFLIRLQLFERRIAPIPRKLRTARISEYAQRYARQIESDCLRYPLQWYNFYDFWHGAGRAGQDQSEAHGAQAAAVAEAAPVVGGANARREESAAMAKATPEGGAADARRGESEAGRVSVSVDARGEKCAPIAEAALRRSAVEARKEHEHENEATR